jgi:hypothetical protein
MAATTIPSTREGMKRSTREGERKQIGQVEPESRREGRDEMAAMTIRSNRVG